MELYILKVNFRRLIILQFILKKKAFTVDNDIYVTWMVKRGSTHVYRLQNSKIWISLGGGPDDLRTRCLHQESISPKRAAKLACAYHTDARGAEYFLDRFLDTCGRDL